MGRKQGQRCCSKNGFCSAWPDVSSPNCNPLPQRQHLYYKQREYAGQTLAEHLRLSGRLGLPEWLDIAPRLIQALGMLRRRNILHRDIKPKNFLWVMGRAARIGLRSGLLPQSYPR
jgi:serine/threonine protein kinase